MSFDASGEYVATECEKCGENLAHCPHVPDAILDRMRREGVREAPVCVTCRGDETVPLVGAAGGQYDPCGDCVIRGIPAVE